ncbi:hypothetical protein BSKO_04066 [Bryopsis sp. KO-2023]|nr:hypothetical protein BSKO_04066 [Bryopsis sp. KO-2023]
MSKLTSLLRSTAQVAKTLAADEGSVFQRYRGLFGSQFRNLSGGTPAKSELTSADIEHATGLEKIELEGQSKGVDIFEEEWLNSPFGTAEKPVEVISANSERIVGVPDPDDDSIVVWGVVKENEGPRQIVEGGEYFILKRQEPPEWAKEDH